MVTGFVPPDSGAIAINGHDTLDASALARREIGYLPESAPAYAEMTTRDYLDYRGRLYRMPRKARREAMADSIAKCDLGDVAGRRVGHLSRGYRQRVGLAAAILHGPPVLVLDEPTSALDPRQIRQIRQLMRDLAAARAVLVSSHILPEVEQTCDRIIVMARGRVRLDARPQELLARHTAAAPLVAQLKGEASVVNQMLKAVSGVTGVEQVSPADPPWHSYVIYGNGSLEEAIAAAAARAGLGLRELRRQAPSLERIFLDLIESDDPEKQA
jgi:ABC-2 type transport system ATP-binding protein